MSLLVTVLAIGGMWLCGMFDVNLGLKAKEAPYKPPPRLVCVDLEPGIVVPSGFQIYDGKVWYLK